MRREERQTLRMAQIPTGTTTFEAPKDGLCLDWAAEEAFGNGQIIIVPHNESNDGQRWELQVVDLSFLGIPMKRLRGLHKMEPDSGRATAMPGHRYLYSHHTTTLLCLHSMKKPGWQTLLAQHVWIGGQMLLGVSGGLSNCAAELHEHSRHVLSTQIFT